MFGLVNEDQIKQMKDSVQSMLEVTRHDMQEMKTFSGHVSTYLKANNQRLDGLVETLKTVQKDAFTYAHAVGDNVSKQVQMIASLTAFITKGTQTMKSLEQEYRGHLSAMETLVAGHISPYLFPVSLLHRIMTGISESLLKNFGATIWLPQRDPSYYYHTAEFSYIRVNDTSVAITINFPVAQFRQRFEWYRPITFPLPVSSDSEHATLLMDMPILFAISQDWIRKKLLSACNELQRRNVIDKITYKNNVAIIKCKENL